MLLLIILVSLFKTFPISSSKDEHAYGHHGKEDKYVGFLWINAPKCCNLVNGNGGYRQIKVFCIS